MIVSDIKKITNEFFNQKFANRLLKDQRTLRIGNIASTLCPVELTDHNGKRISNQSINFVLEIPDISTYAGVCVQQLFITNVANILSQKIYTDAPMEIINTDIIIKKEHIQANIHQLDGIVSMNHIKNVNGAILIYLGLYNEAGENATPRAFSLHMKDELCYKFMDEVNAMFYNMVNNIFLNTAKI